jgi:hypothetical protein
MQPGSGVNAAMPTSEPTPAPKLCASAWPQPAPAAAPTPTGGPKAPGPCGLADGPGRSRTNAPNEHAADAGLIMPNEQLATRALEVMRRSPSYARPPVHQARYPKTARTAGLRAFSLTSLVAQRDAGIGIGASGSRILRRPGGLGRGGRLAAACPGMAACRVPARWMIRGWCPSPARDPDRGHPRHSAMRFASGQDDGPRAACSCGRRCQRYGSPGRPCRRQNSTSGEGPKSTCRTGASRP